VAGRRDPRGVRYALASVLALVTAAMLADCETLADIIAWISHAPRQELEALGCRAAPCGRTVTRILALVSPGTLSRAVGAWLARAEEKGPVTFARIEVVPSRGQLLSCQPIADGAGHLVTGDCGIGGGHVGDQVRERRGRAIPAMAAVAGAAAPRLVIAGPGDMKRVPEPEGVPFDAPPGIGVIGRGDPGMAGRETVAVRLLLPPPDHLPPGCMDDRCSSAAAPGAARPPRGS
jgi:hypothetical protein